MLREYDMRSYVKREPMCEFAAVRVLGLRSGVGGQNMRVLIVDDQPLVADAFGAYLRTIDPDAIVVAGRSTSEIEALNGDGRPDLVLIDFDSPKIGRFAAMRRMRTRFAESRVVLTTSSATRRDMRSALEKGAAGIIPKQLSRAAITKALELILAGEVYIPSRLLERGGLEEGRADYQSGAGAGEARDVQRLTPRQNQVLALLLKGYSNRQIAQELGCREVTVAFHLKGVFKRLGVSNRTQAATKALELGWRASASNA